MSYHVLGYGYAWWHGDPLPLLSPLTGFQVAPTEDEQLIADLAQLEREEIANRLRLANRAYVAYLDQHPVAYGWSAAHMGALYELAFDFPIPPGNCYLWDFVTLPAWRGRGIYPRLLQAILISEADKASRFWIGHTTDNIASQHGITKAGFQLVEALAIVPTGNLQILPIGEQTRVQVSPMGLKLGVLALNQKTVP